MRAQPFVGGELVGAVWASLLCSSLLTVGGLQLKLGYKNLPSLARLYG